MRQTFVLLGALAMLVAQPLITAQTATAQTAAAQDAPHAAQTGPLPPASLAPGKPSGVKPAQAGDLVPIYGSVLLFGALLAATIGVTGSASPPTAPASSTNFCCG